MIINKSMNTIINYLKSVRSELTHVVWPTKKATINHTILVIVISTIVAIFLFQLDGFFAKLLDLFIK